MKCKWSAKNWRMKKMCENCPFSSRGPGLELRKTLRPKRWESILGNLRQGGHFYCHKTSRDTGDDSYRLCAGSLKWQVAHKTHSILDTILERMPEGRPGKS